MEPSKNSSELVRGMETRHNGSRPHISSIPRTLSQGDPSIPTLSLTGEDGSSCPIYTPEESIITPLRSVQADSMLDIGYAELDGSRESPSPDRRIYLNCNPCTTSEISLDRFETHEDLSSDQSNRSIHESGVNHGMSLDDDMDLDNDIPQNTQREGGGYMYPWEEEPRNTLGGK